MGIKIHKIELADDDMRTHALLLFTEKFRKKMIGTVVEMIADKDLHNDFINSRYDRLHSRFGIKFLQFLDQFFETLRDGLPKSIVKNSMGLIDEGGLGKYLANVDSVEKGSGEKSSRELEIEVKLGPDDGKAMSLLLYATSLQDEVFIMKVVSLVNDSNLLDDFRRSRYENIVEQFDSSFIKRLVKFFVFADDDKEAEILANTADLILNDINFDLDK